MEKGKYVQYGCGLSAPPGWTNYDASPTLRIQRIFILGSIVRKRVNVVFPPNVKYGDIIKGLPEADNSCDGIYCSHVLEHLALNDFRTALANTYKILKPGGMFRCVVPDLEWAAREYIKSFDGNDESASFEFLKETLLGTQKRIRGIKGVVAKVYGNSSHLWMWDRKSLSKELRDAGFSDVRVCSFNDSEDDMFKPVESEGRFIHAVALECRKKD